MDNEIKEILKEWGIDTNITVQKPLQTMDQFDNVFIKDFPSDQTKEPDGLLTGIQEGDLNPEGKLQWRFRRI